MIIGVIMSYELNICFYITSASTQCSMCVCHMSLKALLTYLLAAEPSSSDRRNPCVLVKNILLILLVQIITVDVPTQVLITSVLELT